MRKPVGFDQKILLHQLDYTAKQSRQLEKKDMYETLDVYLRKDIKGDKSRKNVITMLMKIWYKVPPYMHELQTEILNEFNSLNKEERLFVHWCMIINAYPFFKDIITEFGRLFKLQEKVSSQVIGKRMKESYGDRRRVEVSTSAVISSLKAWETIILDEKKMYKENVKLPIAHFLLQELMFETMMNVSNQPSFIVNTVLSHSMFFPFEFHLDTNELKQREGNLNFYFQGTNELVVESKRETFST